MSIKQINFLVDNMGATQLSYSLTRELNWLQTENRNIDCIVYYNNLYKHAMLPNFAIMQMVEAWAQPGITIATSLSTAAQLISYPGPSLKIYYMWDLPWMRLRPKIYRITQQIVTTKDLILLARSHDHAIAIANAYNVEQPHVIQNANIKQMLREIDLCQQQT